MSEDPILIVQMQRMGDLILTFPLIVDLHMKYPKTPIWVVAEKIFFAPLIRLAPNVTFFEPTALDSLAKHHFSKIINVSSRPEASSFLAKADTAQKLGCVTTESVRQVLGFWQLYRYCLTQNNRHNTLHWADLNRLDLFASIDAVPIRGYTIQKHPGVRIGIVIGASVAYKHPDPAFWIQLSQALIREGFLPFFFGGTNEKETGETIARSIGIAKANMCGKLTLTDVAAFFKTLSLCITPDTGPMHLADWLGIPVLSLSMGSVRAFETGPYSQNQYSIVPNMSCAGCWECHGKLYRCKKKFHAGNVLKYVKALLNETNSFPTHNKNLTLYKCVRNDNLADLCAGEEKKNAQYLLDLFIRQTFFALYDPVRWNDTKQILFILQSIHQLYPKLFERLKKTIQIATHTAFLGMKRQEKSLKTPHFPALAILLDFLDLYIKNSLASLSAWKTVCLWLSQLENLFSKV